jgi:hypothetical protein
MIKDLLRLITLGVITTSNIVNSTVQAGVITELKAEVAAGTITAEQYKACTGADYIAATTASATATTASNTTTSA